MRYNAEHTCTILKEDATHVLVQLDTGDKFCVSKTALGIPRNNYQQKLF